MARLDNLGRTDRQIVSESMESNGFRVIRGKVWSVGNDGKPMCEGLNFASGEISAQSPAKGAADKAKR